MQEYSLDRIVQFTHEARSSGESVVLTNGCFDILHIGHLRYLQASKALGDHLIVAVNSDESVRSLKGSSRPINHQFDRASLISAFRCVDAVFIFPGPRLDKEILKLQPNLYTKAGDYTLETLDPSERNALFKVGADIRFLPFYHGYSSSSTISHLQSSKTTTSTESQVDLLSFPQTLDVAKVVIEQCHALAPTVEQIGRLLISCLQSGGKLLTCGNGGSAADALHMAEELVGRYSKDRIALPAICLNSDVTVLTCIANDYGFDAVYSRQIQGLARRGDMMICFTTSGNSQNIIKAIEQANKMGLITILVTGKDGGRAKGLCELEVIVPSNVTARIQEIHTLLLHQWLEFVDAQYA